MANAIRGNKIYVDTTGEITTKRQIVTTILFTPDSNNDQIVIREISSDVDIMKIRGSIAKQTIQLRFDAAPLVFGNGIYIQTLSTGATAVLVTTTRGD
jgi:hypothetical protein